MHRAASRTCEVDSARRKGIAMRGIPGGLADGVGSPGRIDPRRSGRCAHTYNASPMRNPTFHRRMTLLALAAMLLLLSLPTAGRLLAGGAESQGAWAQMCTMAGLKLVKLTPGGETNPIHAPAPKPAMPGEDCAYCPVLAGLAMLLVWALLAPLQSPQRAVPRTRATPRRDFLHPSGLGSRGPPIAL
jgi:hypothetical protein